jgi:hypothetical protein
VWRPQVDTALQDMRGNLNTLRQQLGRVALNPILGVHPQQWRVSEGDPTLMAPSAMGTCSDSDLRMYQGDGLGFGFHGGLDTMLRVLNSISRCSLESGQSRGRGSVSHTSGCSECHRRHGWTRPPCTSLGTPNCGSRTATSISCTLLGQRCVE